MDTTQTTLLLRIRSLGDRKAWAEFDSIYRPMLYRFGVARGLSHADAEDIVQQCMSAIQEHIRHFEYDAGRGRFRGWLKTMVNRRISNLLRGRREVALEDVNLVNTVARNEPPEAVFDRIWKDEHLRHCLAQLEKEVDRTAFLAFRRYVLEEQATEVVCAELGVIADYLYKVKWRLTQRLQVKMKELIDDEEIF